ncbi:MAG TPA: hypothetical protein VF607_08895, partial [Verrucomicrobiae bacterium]
QWSYKKDTGVRHLGPMAQDFHAAFAVGSDERHIASLDEDGVALAAIQGLNQKWEDQIREFQTQAATNADKISQLENENAELRTRLSRVEELLEKMAAPH